MQGAVEDLNNAIYRAKPKLYPSRQRLTLPSAEAGQKPRVLESGKKLSDYDISASSQITFKDLGPQVGNLSFLDLPSITQLSTNSLL